MWWIRTEFVGVELEHGNWSAHGHDTEAEARAWWHAAQGKTSYVRVQTLTNPEGTIVESRTITPGSNG